MNVEESSNLQYWQLENWNVVYWSKFVVFLTNSGY